MRQILLFAFLLVSMFAFSQSQIQLTDCEQSITKLIDEVQQKDRSSTGPEWTHAVEFDKNQYDLDIVRFCDLVTEAFDYIVFCENTFTCTENKRQQNYKHETKVSFVFYNRLTRNTYTVNIYRRILLDCQPYQYYTSVSVIKQ